MVIQWGSTVLNGTYSDLMVFQWGLMELKIVIDWIMNGIYPPAMANIAIENGSFIVSFPRKNDDFPYLCWFTREYGHGQ